MISTNERLQRLNAVISPGGDLETSSQEKAAAVPGAETRHERRIDDLITMVDRLQSQSCMIQEEVVAMHRDRRRGAKGDHNERSTSIFRDADYHVADERAGPLGGAHGYRGTYYDCNDTYNQYDGRGGPSGGDSGYCGGFDGDRYDSTIPRTPNHGSRAGTPRHRITVDQDNALR